MPARPPVDRALMRPPHIPAQWPPPSSPARNTPIIVVSGIMSVSNHPGIIFALPALPEVTVEHHADNSDQQSPLWRDDDPVGPQFDESVLFQAPQIPHLLRKIIGKVNQVG